MKVRIRLALAVFAMLALGAFALTGCGGAQHHRRRDLAPPRRRAESGMLNISGSDTMVNMAQAWAEAYAEVNPNVAITVKGGGSGNGIAALINRTVDFADASRDMKPEESTQAKAPASTRSRPWSPRTASSSSSTPPTRSPTSPRTTSARSTAARSRTGRTSAARTPRSCSSAVTRPPAPTSFMQDEVVGKDKLLRQEHAQPAVEPGHRRRGREEPQRHRLRGPRLRERDHQADRRRRRRPLGRHRARRQLRAVAAR